MIQLRIILLMQKLMNNDEILRVCKFAAADEFMKNYKEIWIVIGENGVRFSGGQNKGFQ